MPVSPEMLAQSVLPLGDWDHSQATPLTLPSSSVSAAVTSTRAWTTPVSVVSVTVPGSSTFSTVMVTFWVESVVVSVLPEPSRPSWTFTVTL